MPLAILEVEEFVAFSQLGSVASQSPMWKGFRWSFLNSRYFSESDEDYQAYQNAFAGAFINFNFQYFFLSLMRITRRMTVRPEKLTEDSIAQACRIVT